MTIRLARRLIALNIVMERPPKTSAERAATTIRRSVVRLARRLRWERADHGLSGSKLIVLGHLLRSGVLTAKDLASLEHIRPQSLTRILASLEKDGFIRREQGTDDRREVRIEISEKGRMLLAIDAARQDTWLDAALSNTLTEAEQSVLALAARLLDRVSDLPRDRRDTDAGSSGRKPS